MSSQKGATIKIEKEKNTKKAGDSKQKTCKFQGGECFLIRLCTIQASVHHRSYKKRNGFPIQSSDKQMQKTNQWMCERMHVPNTGPRPASSIPIMQGFDAHFGAAAASDPILLVLFLPALSVIPSTKRGFGALL